MGPQFYESVTLDARSHVLEARLSRPVAVLGTRLFGYLSLDIIIVCFQGVSKRTRFNAMSEAEYYIERDIDRPGLERYHIDNCIGEFFLFTYRLVFFMRLFALTSVVARCSNFGGLARQGRNLFYNIDVSVQQI